MAKHIVITGVGVLASNGIGKDVFWNALKSGISGIKPVSLFDTASTRSKLAGQINDFAPEAILGKKGLRNLDRSTKLVNAAAKLALDDANYAITNESMAETTGVSIGSTMGSVWSISEFDKEALRDGPRAVNPAVFPNTVMNSPASQISIKFNIKGFNTTISTGFTSSTDAISYALNFIRLYDYDVVLAGGVEELCEQTYKGFHKIGHLAGSRPGKEEVNCPFDRRRNGIVIGEAAAIFVLEDFEHARKRGAKIYAEVLGYGTSFDPRSKNIYSPKAEGATEAIEYALQDADLSPNSIDYISASANSTLDCDVMETRAIKNIFGAKAKDIPVSSIKSMVGETFSASGAMSLAASLGVLEKDFIPPTINYEIPDRRCDLDYVRNKSKEARVDKILMNTFSPTGSNSSIVLSRFKEE